MQSKVLSRKLTKGFLDRLYRHARESGQPEDFEIPGFRLALTVASLAGMAVDIPKTDFDQRLPYTPRADIWIHCPTAQRLSREKIDKACLVEEYCSRFCCFSDCGVPEYTTGRVRQFT